MLKKLTAVSVLITTSCASWQTQTAPVPRVVEEARAAGESYLRVELNSGQRHEIHAAAVIGDSIVGRSEPGPGPDAKRLAFATSDIKSVAQMKFSSKRMLVILAVLAGVFVALGAYAVSGL